MTSPSKRALQLIHESIAKPKTLDDTALLSETDNDLREQLAEFDAVTLADTLHVFASQIRQILFGTDVDRRWTDVPPIPLLQLANAGTPVTNEIPSGLLNSVNLAYDTADVFVAGSLEVTLGNIPLISGLDFTENVSHDGFTIIVNPNDRHRLNRPPQPHEPLRVNYRKVV